MILAILLVLMAGVVVGSIAGSLAFRQPQHTGCLVFSAVALVLGLPAFSTLVLLVAQGTTLFSERPVVLLVALHPLPLLSTFGIRFIDAARNALERYVHFVAISGAALRLEEDDQAYVPLASTPCNMPAVTSDLD